MNYLVLNRIRVKKGKNLGGKPLPKLSPTPGERCALYKGIRIPGSVKFLLVESKPWTGCERWEHVDFKCMWYKQFVAKKSKFFMSLFFL